MVYVYWKRYDNYSNSWIHKTNIEHSIDIDKNIKNELVFFLTV